MKEHRALEIILRAANFFVTFVVVTALCVTGMYAVYALWDNNRIYAAAQDVQADMMKYKPKADAHENEGPSFEELLNVNPDVCGWVTLDNTKIDHPVLQGETNLSYINTDVYGDFALAGSIYLDSNNDRGFKDAYSVLYGHNMENGRMFGDLGLYNDKEFFDRNRTGTLILPAKAYDLEIFACMTVRSSDEYIFEPEKWRADIEGLLKYTEQNALHLSNDGHALARPAKEKKVLALTTCSSEFTDARTIILAAMYPHPAAKAGGI